MIWVWACLAWGGWLKEQLYKGAVGPPKYMSSWKKGWGEPTPGLLSECLGVCPPPHLLISPSLSAGGAALGTLAPRTSWETTESSRLRGCRLPWQHPYMLGSQVPSGYLGQTMGETVGHFRVLHR